MHLASSPVPPQRLRSSSMYSNPNQAGHSCQSPRIEIAEEVDEVKNENDEKTDLERRITKERKVERE